MLSGKTLLITGGTGTFGNAVMRRFLGTDIRQIRIFSRDEQKQEDMRVAYRSPKLRFYIGDVRDYGSVRPAVQGVDYIFHAAALKQVPSCEFHPLEALRTNAIGAENVMNAARDAGVRTCLLLSTDKAAYPINAMGISKAMMEKLAVAKARLSVESSTTFACTRYGNVMGSRGSVIPLFIEQARAGRPITVTDPTMTRFMMSIDEAVDLVMHALEHAKPGDIFVKKAPAATIGDIALAIRDLFGKTDISVIGTRHGEKLFETLLTREECARAEEQDTYYRVPMDDRDLNYAAYVSEGQVLRTQDDHGYNSHNTDRLGLAETRQLIATLNGVHELMPNRSSELVL
jgi:UDP-N-acetylglucosamine 4,6-dehydratase